MRKFFAICNEKRFRSENADIPEIPEISLIVKK